MIVYPTSLEVAVNRFSSSFPIFLRPLSSYFFLFLAAWLAHGLRRWTKSAHLQIFQVGAEDRERIGTASVRSLQKNPHFKVFKMIQTDLQMSSESFGLLLNSPAFSWCMDHYGSRIVCLLLGFPSSTSVLVFVPRFVIGLQSAFHVPKVALLCSSPATTISSCALQVRDPYRLYDCNTELKLSSAGLKRKLRHKDNKKMSNGCSPSDQDLREINRKQTCYRGRPKVKSLSASSSL